MKNDQLMTPMAAERLLREWAKNLAAPIPTSYETIRAAIRHGELRAVSVRATDSRVMLAVSVGDLRRWANARVAIEARKLALRQTASNTREVAP